MNFIEKNLVYLFSFFLCLDFIIGNLLGWFSNNFLSLLYLLVILVVILVKPKFGISMLIFTQVFDMVILLGLRPYQWITFIICLVIFIRKKLRVKFIKFLRDRKNYQFFIILILLLFSSLFGTLNAGLSMYSLKQDVVLSSSLLIVFLIYWGVKTKNIKIQEFRKSFIFSSLPVAIFAIYQNIAYEHGLASFEVMAARPNAFFYEPDWLGIYLVIVFPFLIIQILTVKNNFKAKIGLWLIVLLNIIVLIISVARASWLGFIGSIVVFVLFAIISFVLKKITKRDLTKVIKVSLGCGGMKVLALIIISCFNLTRFDLKDRFESIYKGKHVITMAENSETGEKFKIDLEEIEEYKEKGYKVFEEKISDENIQSRYSAYRNNLAVIKEHWILGYGQGRVQQETDYIHNANNIFYEWWIAGGILGIGAFIFLNVILLKSSVLFITKKCKIKKRTEITRHFLNQELILMVISGIVITNLFNSGIFFIPIWAAYGFLFTINAG
jgi:hypothetical protein